MKDSISPLMIERHSALLREKVLSDTVFRFLSVVICLFTIWLDRWSIGVALMAILLASFWYFSSVRIRKLIFLVEEQISRLSSDTEDWEDKYIKFRHLDHFTLRVFQSVEPLAWGALIVAVDTLPRIG